VTPPEEHDRTKEPLGPQHVLGTLLREARKARFPTAEKLLEQLNKEEFVGDRVYQHNTLSNWEHGHHVPRRDVIDWYEAQFGFERGHLVELHRRAERERGPGRKAPSTRKRDARDDVTDVPDGTSEEERAKYADRDLHAYLRDLDDYCKKHNRPPASRKLLNDHPLPASADAYEPANRPPSDERRDTVDDADALGAASDLARAHPSPDEPDHGIDPARHNPPHKWLSPAPRPDDQLNVPYTRGARRAQQPAAPTAPAGSRGHPEPALRTGSDAPRAPGPDAAAERSQRKRRRWLAAGVMGIGAAIAAVATVLWGGGSPRDDCPPHERPLAPTGDGGRSRPKAAAANVLFLIDVTDSMRHKDLNCLDPDDGKRLQAATAFVAAGLERDEQIDRVGVWLVTNSDEAPVTNSREGPDCPWDKRTPAEPTYCVLKPFTLATEATRSDIAKRLQRVKGNQGGTPLYPAIAEAVRALRRDHGKGHGDANAVLSVIAITDGVNTVGSRAELLAAALDDDPPVQILITAFSEDLCRKELAQTIDRYYPSRCYPARSGEEATQVATDIPIDLLHLAP